MPNLSGTCKREIKVLNGWWQYTQNCILFNIKVEDGRELKIYLTKFLLFETHQSHEQMNYNTHCNVVVRSSDLVAKEMKSTHQDRYRLKATQSISPMNL